MKTSKAAKKSYYKMNAAELAEATKEFDQPLPAARFKPLSTENQARFQRAKKSGGFGVQNIYAFGLDPLLMDQAARFAKRKKMTLAELVERGVRGVLAFSE